MLADVSIATGWMTIALMLTGRFVFQVCKQMPHVWHEVLLMHQPAAAPVVIHQLVQTMHINLWPAYLPC
jgi:hypothetical protein